jgi:hypothetical protein
VVNLIFEALIGQISEIWRYHGQKRAKRERQSRGLVILISDMLQNIFFVKIKIFVAQRVPIIDNPKY